MYGDDETVAYNGYALEIVGTYQGDEDAHLDMDVSYRVETADHHIINDFDQTVDFDGDLPFPDDDDTAVTKGGTSTYVEVLAVPATTTVVGGLIDLYESMTFDDNSVTYLAPAMQ